MLNSNTSNSNQKSPKAVKITNNHLSHQFFYDRKYQIKIDV